MSESNADAGQTERLEELQARPDESGPAQRPEQRFRWKIFLLLLAFAVVSFAAQWWLMREDATTRVMVTMGFVSFDILMLLVFWLFFSGLSRRAKKIGLGVLAVLTILFFSLFRVVGYRGEMLPILVNRWTPTAEEISLAYFEEQDRLMSDEPISSEFPEITEADWPGFRGPRRDGIVMSAEWRRNWDDNPPKELWRHPVGLGWSSFAVVGDWVFTQEQRGENEAVVCYELQTGRQRWVWNDKARFSETLGGDGPRATPTVAGQRVYALGATGILNCLEATTGKLVWSRNILDDADALNISWGMTGSPLVFDDKVVVNPGGGNDAGVIAYDKNNGEILWKNGDRVAAYCAPRLETIDGIRQVVTYGGEGVAGHEIETGDELWFFPWTNSDQIIAAQTILLPSGLMFVSAGYGKGSALFEVKHVGGTWSVDEEPVEATSQFKLKFNDGVYRDGYIYGLDEGILACHDATTLKRKWKRGRFGYGQLLLVDDVLLIQAESGDVVLVEATPDAFREMTRIEALTDRTWNHPVLVDGLLLVRNDREAACFDVSLSEDIAVKPHSSDVNLTAAASALKITNK